jgi:hypothetical protein
MTEFENVFQKDLITVFDNFDNKDNDKEEG